MWKYVSRRIRDTFERSVNHFDKRSTTGVVNSASNASEDKSKRLAPPCCFWRFSSKKCWKSFNDDNDTNSKRWNFDQLNRSWIGAITWGKGAGEITGTWELGTVAVPLKALRLKSLSGIGNAINRHVTYHQSSALVVGWYTSQLFHLKYKYCKNKHHNCLTIQNLSSALHPYVKHIDANVVFVNSTTNVSNIIETFTPTVYLISNDPKNSSKERSTCTTSTTSTCTDTNTNPDSTDGDLGQVLNSIENRLGLAAIGNGQLQDGLNLLRSAANRKHAPALYNLGLCYEIGIGVSVDEKAAMELYRSAAALEHPGALYNLGIYYGQGRGGLTRDIGTATRLLKLAAVQGQQDAVNALKSLEVDSENSSLRNDVSWHYQYSPYTHNDNIVPTFTNLFVENVNYTQQHSCHTTVY